MRKLLSILVIALLFIGLLPLRGDWTFNARAVSGNEKANMMFLYMYPVGYDSDGSELGGGRNFPWEPTGASYWGTYFPDNEEQTYLMPNAGNARTLAGTPLPVKNRDNPLLYTEPTAWAYVDLSVEAAGGRSTSYNRWYAVLDDDGQLWLDPDGVFHDPRYDATADPSNMLYRTQNCVENPLARIDPSRSNNTQGPYRITQGGGYRDKIYFWDRDISYKPGTNRAFRIGWTDQLYYYDENSMVTYGDDEFFLNKADPQNHVIFTERTTRFSQEYYYYDANFNGQYDAGEPVYRKGTGTDAQVQEGDYRYTFVSIEHENQVFNYRASATSAVREYDMDHALRLTPFTYTSSTSEVRFIDRNHNGRFDVGEPVYIDRPYTHTATNQHFPIGHVTPGDTRLSTVERDPKSNEPTLILSLLELLRAHCDGTKYDITVSTDVWTRTTNPATTAARLRSPNGEFLDNAQRVQRSTVLGPSGDDFIVPATTFHDIPLHYRSYIGVQIFNDNGFDNNRGTPLPYDNVLPQSLSDEYRPQRTGEVFLGASNSAVGLNYLDFGHPLTNFPDYVMYYDTRYEENIVNTNYAPHFGCGEPLYRISQENMNVFEVQRESDPTLLYQLQAGDVRLNDVMVDRGGNMIQYSFGTRVAPGDADIGWQLHPMHTNVDENNQPYLDDNGLQMTLNWRYADGLIFNELLTEVSDDKYIRNGEYDPGEMIYFDLSNNGRVDIGDIRLTSGHFSGIPVECGSALEHARETWRHEYPLRMLTMGLNGDPRFIDIEVLPGDLPMEVSIDPPLQVEQTSTVRLGLGRPLKDDEKVYVSIRGPRPGFVEDDDRPFVHPAEGLLTGWEDPTPEYLGGDYLNIAQTGPGIIGWPSEVANIGGRLRTGWQLGDNAKSAGINLWGEGPDGFRLGNTIFTHIFITEDGMVLLTPGNPGTNTWLLANQTSYPMYQDPPYNTWYDYYGGRPYPYSYGGQPGWAGVPGSMFSNCQNATQFPYFNWYNQSAMHYPGPIGNWTASAGYIQAESLFQKEAAWIMPLGGQWHIPAGPPTFSPQFYPRGMYAFALEDEDNPEFPYGVYYKRTEEYIRVVWKVVTWPFQNGRYQFNPQPWWLAIHNQFHSDNNFATNRISDWTSEFDMIMYRDGTITFNYNRVNVPPNRFRVIDNDQEPRDLDPTNWVDTDPGATGCTPGAWEGRVYIPYIGIVQGVEDLRAFSHRSYRYDPNPNSRTFESPEGLTIGWILPEDPDEDLFNERIFEDYSVLDKDNPYYEFQYTPYRGSVHDGYHGADATLAGTTLFNQFEIRAYSERGGIRTPVPMDSDFTGNYNSNYIDPFWKRSLFNRAEWQENYRKEPIFVIPVEPVNTMPNSLRDYYDSFAHLKYDIRPEKIDIVFDRECIDLVSSRQPSFSFEVLNANNPNDVNDPHGTHLVFPKWYAGTGTTPERDGSYDWGISLDGEGTYGRPTIMNYNVHGAGINYLFTAQLQGGGVYRRYIVQVNSNGTAEAWRWFEADMPGQVFGAFDQHDMLYSIRSERIASRGQFDPMNGNSDPNNMWYKVPDPFNAGTGFTDVNCSSGIMDLLLDLVENDHGFPSFGDVTQDDHFGIFRNNPSVNDRAANMPLHNDTGFSDAYLSAIVTYGVPVVIMSPEDDFSGGVGLGIANPKNADSPLTVRLYATNIMFDYNSSIAHPPNYIYDEGSGINYLGYQQLRVVPADPILNFAEFTVVDRALQLSKENYTAGNNSWYELPPPNPQIQAHYNPIIRDWSGFRSYPGGQTHTGRALPIDPSIPHQGSGRNAYPALQARQFHKLGTEFFPMTDYGIFFTLRDLGRNHYTFDPLLVEPEALLLRRVTVRGPFMYPKIYSEPDAKMDTSFRYQGIDNVPITYDTSGEIVIDATNSQLWALPGTGFNRSINLGRSVPYEILNRDKNKYARYTHSLYYGTRGANPYGLFFEGDTVRSGGGQSQPAAWFTNAATTGYNFYSPSAVYQVPHNPQPNTVSEALNNRGVHTFILDELIPTGPGNIEIIVETADGVVKHYQDCCQEDAPMGITVEGLKIDGAPSELVVDQDNSIELTLIEYDRKGDHDHPVAHPVSNNALMVAWQDRGVINPMTGELIGAGDGWLTNPPRSSDFTNIGTMYLPSDDLNGDGKISFNDWETEIMGSYDLATNTWTSGFIDARTFQRNDGRYRMDFTSQNKNIIDTVGIDFGGLNLRQPGTLTNPDGVIGDDEMLPIIINAYKYGDDNNDRAFTPLYNLPGRFPEFSHEVYLTGRVEIPVRAQQSLTVTTIPDILTAGVQPELQDLSEPLTFVVTDEAGAPLDLLDMARRNLRGVDHEWVDEIELTRAIWNGLFKDPHPDPLPQYYWTRTDLHNDDGTPIGNTYMFSNQAGRFEPIEFDLTQSHDGKYMFRGFTSNDAGAFDVFVYTPDRRRMGKVKVQVELPNVSYSISNYDDHDNRAFASPGTPDFIMTAGDNNIYRVRVQVRDAQGRPLAGIGKSVSICGGGNQEVSRFTPFLTTHQNYYRAIQPKYWHYYGQGTATWRRSFYYNGSFTTWELMPYHWGDRWNAHIAVDTNNNGQIDVSNNEISRTQPFPTVVPYTSPTGFYGISRPIDLGFQHYSGQAFYNTENIKYENGTFATTPMFDINSELNPVHGWGFGAIYNRPYYTDGNLGMIFANLDRLGNNLTQVQTQTLSNTDSLNLDVNGETEFFVFGEDVFEVGGLVGKNSWSISPWADVAGAPYHYSPTDPNRITSRYGRQIVLPADLRGRVAYQTAGDYAYRLDWDGMPSHVANVRPPRVEVLNAETNQPLGKNFMDEHAYDLVYGKDNHVTINVYPADERDLPVKSEMQLILAGNSAEYRVTGRLKQEGLNPGDASSTTMYITPTGTGLTAISLDSITKNHLKDYMSVPSDHAGISPQVPLPDNYFLLDLIRFDVAKGIRIQAQTVSGPLALNQPNNLKIVVSEIGSNRPLGGVRVTLSGAGINETKTSSDEGLCFFDGLVPGTEEPIRITAQKEGFIDGRDSIDVGMRTGRGQDWIHLNASPNRTNQPLYELSGNVEDNVAMLSINRTNIAIQPDRTFKATITLTEGQNTVLIEMEDQQGRINRKILTIVLKTTGPSVIIDDFLSTEKFVGIEHIELSGSIDPGSILIVNGLPATIEGNRFTSRVPVQKGNNILTFVAEDDLGNKTQITKDIYVYTLRKIEFILGSKTARIDGRAVQMDQAPFVENGRTYVPLRMVSESFGAEISWNQDTRGITVELNDTKIYMTIGSNRALVNNMTVELDAPPLLRNGRTFVPVRFVSEWLGGTVEWNERLRMILIECLL